MSVNFNTLTLKQKKVYSAIESFIKLKGIPPTVREIGEMVGEKTPGAVQGILNRLEQKGVIKREVGIARSIQLVSDNTNYENPIYLPEIKKITQRNVEDLLSIYNISKYYPFPSFMIGASDECFIIKCPDLSLEKSGISREDMLVVCTNSDFNDGDIVVALYETHVMLRRYYSTEQEEVIKLEADIDLLGQEYFNRDEVKIVGKLISKLSKYK